MSELKAYIINGLIGHVVQSEFGEFYIKKDVDKVIADLEESHKKEVSNYCLR